MPAHPQLKKDNLVTSKHCNMSSLVRCSYIDVVIPVDCQ